MIITDSDFRFIPTTPSSGSFDVELLHTITNKSGESRQEFKNVAYGISLDSAIQRVIRYRVYNKHKDQALTIKQYLDEFKKELKKLKDYCNSYEEI